MISKYLQEEDTLILARSRIGNRLGNQAARFWPAEAETRNVLKPVSWGAIRFHRNPAQRESSGIYKREHSLADSPCPKLAARSPARLSQIWGSRHARLQATSRSAGRRRGKGRSLRRSARQLK